MPGGLSQLFAYVLTAVCIPLVFIALYIFPTVAAFSNSTGKLVRTAFYFSVKHVGYTLAVAVITIIPMLMTLVDAKLFPVYLFVWLLCGFSLTAYADAWFMWRMFKHYFGEGEKKQLMKWITYNETTKVFVLRTQNSMYQMQIGKYDTLVHLYYGADIGDTEATHRIVCLDRGFSGNPYEAGEDRTFSLDVLPQEYSGYGNGDYRINSLEVQHEDGSDAVHLRYESYRMEKGKYSLKGLPAMYGNEDEAETLQITLYDRISNLKVHLFVCRFSGAGCDYKSSTHCKPWRKTGDDSASHVYGNGLYP